MGIPYVPTRPSGARCPIQKPRTCLLQKARLVSLASRAVKVKAELARSDHSSKSRKSIQAAAASTQDSVDVAGPPAPAPAPAPEEVGPQVLPGDVAIASRTRTQPSAVELLAHQLPGRNTHTDRIRWGVDTKLRNQVQLSTYPDCIGGNLSTLTAFAEKCLHGVVGGVHVLPFYPSSADRGFAPLTYKQVDPVFGEWRDIQALREDLDICVDFMVNHISAQSPQFKDFVEKGDESEWADLFIRYHKFWGGEPTEEDLGLIYTRKPRPPYRDVEHPDGTAEKVWCTFDYEQIDIDAFSPLGLEFIEDQLDTLTSKGANLVRLDAFGYTTKKRGTNCFFVEPEVWQLLDRVEAMLHERGTELLCEVHEHFSMQKRLAEQGYWVYDFALPMLTLQALYDSDATNLKAWWLKCPRNQITTLDTHDGLGVVDVADLMTQEQIERTKENIFQRGANANMRYNSAEYGNLDIYQINCSYYSAVGDRDDWYVLARALQLFTPGIPLIYYVGLMAGRNDLELVEQTKTGRDINRHPYTLDEAVSEAERPVVKVLFELCRFRNHHPAFNGTFELLDTIQDILDSTMIVPGTTADGPATTPIPMPGAPAVPSERGGDTGELGASGSFAAQRVSLLASIDGEEADFLADIVLDRSSIDVLASMDRGDLEDGTIWQVDNIITGSMDGDLTPKALSLDGHADSDSPRDNHSTASSDSDSGNPVADERPGGRGRAAVGNGRGFDTSGHGDVAAEPTLDKAERPFRPFSAALMNAHSKEAFMSPAELAAGLDDMSPLQQVRMLRQASKRDPHFDLPASIVCCKWTNGEHWAVLEANLQSKELRVLYVDPFDGRQKVWAVTKTLEVYQEEDAKATS